jgi:hypothetical protein
MARDPGADLDQLPTTGQRLLWVNERTRFAGEVAREVAGSAGGGGDRLNGLG